MNYLLWRPMLSPMKEFAHSFLLQNVSSEFKVGIGHTIFCSKRFFYSLGQFSADVKEAWEVHWTWTVISVSISQKEDPFLPLLSKLRQRLGSVADAVAIRENSVCVHRDCRAELGVHFLELGCAEKCHLTALSVCSDFTIASTHSTRAEYHLLPGLVMSSMDFTDLKDIIL